MTSVLEALTELWMHLPLGRDYLEGCHSSHTLFEFRESHTVKEGTWGGALERGPCVGHGG